LKSLRNDGLPITASSECQHESLRTGAADAPGSRAGTPLASSWPREIRPQAS